MPKIKKVHHVNDVTNVYFSNTIPEILHRYFRLPGKFLRNYTTRIVKRDGSEGEMDWLMLVEWDENNEFENILINVEFQSSKVGKEKIKNISQYKDYAKTYYGFPVLSVIIITDGYESSEREYSIVESDILKPVYIHMGFDELMEKLNNLEDKIHNHENLSEDDGMDMVFIPMFLPEKEGKWVTEKVLHLFKADKTLKKPFRSHVGYGISLMVKKYFKTSKKAEELLEMLEEKVNDSKLRIVAEFEEEYARQLYKRKLSDLNKAVLDKEKAILDKEKVISDKEEVILGQEKVISDKEEVILGQEKALVDKDNILAEKNNEIKFLKAKLEENGISY